MLEPQAEQKTFANPSGGSNVCRSSSPWRMRSDPGASRPCRDPEVPVRRWQRVQWHQPELTIGSVTSKRTPPQLQPPVSGYSGIGEV
jgi:hypothetical protein